MLNKYSLLLATILLSCCQLKLARGAQLRLPEFLLPPPPPAAAAPFALPLTHVRLATIRPATYAQQTTERTDESGFMTRISRWFGFGQDAAKQQQLDGNGQAASKHYYNFVPANNYEDGKPCNQCNKYPWMPMTPVIPWSAPQQQPNGPNSNQWFQVAHNLDVQASQNIFQQQLPPDNIKLIQQQTPAKQRAKQFNFHNYNAPNSNIKQVMPPSNVQLLPFTQPQHHRTTNLYRATAEQQLPAIEATSFQENVAAQSELQSNHFIPTQISPTTAKDANFEIVKSHQITDFVSSVEYPATYVQTQTVDVIMEKLKQEKETTESAKTVKYPHDLLIHNLNSHTPGSQILTDPNSFKPCNMSKEDTTTQDYVEEISTTALPPPFEAQSLVISNYAQQPAYYEGTVNNANEYYGQQTYDNYASASSHNISQLQNDESSVEPFDFIDTTTLSLNSYSLYETTETPKVVKANTEGYKIIPSIQTERQKKLERGRERETPKQLLNSPIQYENGVKNNNRLITSDPSVLALRFSALSSQKPRAFHHANHAYPETDSELQIFETTAPTSTTTTSTLPPREASGHWPLLATVIRNRPRPFEPTNLDTAVAASSPQDIRDQQELPSHARRTKYLTKILASNLKELLHKEREMKRKNETLDAIKLQKTIDVWTEQEFTSRGHRLSTPTIQGRSKHIPTEYLPTTTPTPIPKLIETANLSKSINNLKALLEIENSKRFDYVPIDDNRLLDLDTDKSTTINDKFFLTTSTTTRTTTTTTTDPSVIASSAPKIQKTEPRSKELWRKTKVYISPETKEKIYVVTPQPRYFPQRRYLINEDASEESPTTNVSAPRFSIRPVPGKCLRN